MKEGNLRVTVVIQARLTSTRLPGKIFKDISGKPLLWHLTDRLKSAKKIDSVVLAIPDSPQNDGLADFAGGLMLPCFRGSETDVLARYYGAAMTFGGDVIVRITSDCPLIDPRITDRVIEAHLDSCADYTCNQGFPVGLDTEVFGFGTLERANREAKLNYEREHVTPYMYMHQDQVCLKFVEASGKLNRHDLRLTVYGRGSELLKPDQG